MKTKQTTLQKFTLYSLLAHFFLGGFFLVAPYVATFLSPWLALLGLDFFSPKLDKIKPIVATLRVDVVAMPTHTLRELKNMIISPPQKSTQEESPAQDEEAKAATEDPLAIEIEEKNRKEKFEKMLADLAKKAKQKSPKSSADSKQNEASHKQEGIAASKLQKLILAGNKLSQGTSATASDLADESQSEYESYKMGLLEWVRPNWLLPTYLQENPNLKCRIRIYLRPSGDLIRAELYESSGSDEYDQRAMVAVRQSAPFPPMSEGIKEYGAKGNLLLGFPL